MILTDFKTLIDNSNCPILIFGHDGKVRYFNHSAELLTDMHLSQKLFKLASMYAPKTFGSRTVHLDLTCGTDNFYAITVLYESEEEICIYLYRKPRTLIHKELSFDGYTPTDINLLLEANIELFKMRYNKQLTLFTDYSLPKLLMQQNSFSMLLRKLFEQYHASKNIDITLKIKIGETILIEDKKYPIIVLMIKSDSRVGESDEEINKLTVQNHTTAYFQKESVTLEIPCIVSD